MTETEFISQNKEKWIELEQLLISEQRDANKLNDLFTKVSSDLAYASTYFPNRSVRLYLNNLTKEVFNILPNKTTKNSKDTLLDFFRIILPGEVYRSRHAFYLSFLVFATSLMIGVFSSKQNPEFAAVILGKDYITMTNENIDKNDPMAVYKQEREVDMFFGITINNIRVAFLAFVLGIIGSFGTIFILIQNGIMVGAFQYYFYTKGLFLTSFLTIWIHGTIEISAIIIAGAAGILLGNGVLFPSSYSRIHSLSISARRSLRILLGTIPLFVLAGFLESFVTRYTELPTLVKVMIILLSALLIVYLFVYRPILVSKTKTYLEAIRVTPYVVEKRNINTNSRQSVFDIFIASLNNYRTYITSNWETLFSLILISCGFIFLFSQIAPIEEYLQNDEQINFFNIDSGRIIMPFFLFLLISYYISSLTTHYDKRDSSIKTVLSFYKINFLKFISWSLFVPILCFVFIPGGLSVFAAVVSVLCITIPSFASNDNSKSVFTPYPINNIKLVFSNIFYFTPYYLMLGGLYIIFILLLNSPLSSLLSQFLSWHQIGTNIVYSTIIIDHCFKLVLLLVLSPLLFYIFLNAYNSVLATKTGYAIKSRIEQFGLHV